MYRGNGTGAVRLIKYYYKEHFRRRRYNSNKPRYSCLAVLFRNKLSDKVGGFGRVFQGETFDYARFRIKDESVLFKFFFVGYKRFKLFVDLVIAVDFEDLLRFYAAV